MQSAEPLGGVEPLLSLLAIRPLGLVSDIDGTLAPIVPRPEDARVSLGCRAALAGLIACGVKVVLATGRSLEVARRMVGLDGMVYAANHGLSLCIDGREEMPAAVRAYVARAQQAVEEIGRIGVAGVIVEEKGPVLAFHYRQVHDEDEARREILSAIGGSLAAKDFRIQEGRKVIELRPPLSIDKGTALSLLVARLGVRAVICAGDDATDIDMFRAVARLREGGLPGVNVAVASDEATPEVLASVDYQVDGVAGVEWLLSEILRALPETQP